MFSVSRSRWDLSAVPQQFLGPYTVTSKYVSRQEADCRDRTQTVVY